MVTHSSILAWRIPWTEEPGRLQFLGLQKSSIEFERENRAKEISVDMKSWNSGEGAILGRGTSLRPQTTTSKKGEPVCRCSERREGGAARQRGAAVGGAGTF